jgi:HD-like signal output (HDOD) protein/GGDEF domain-containing protein
MNDASTTLARFVERDCDLYTLPAVAVEVLELARNPQVDARDVKECIERDPALTTKVLRVVNSSLFGLSCEVSDLNHALALLGTKPLKLLVLGFSLPDALFTEVAGEILSRYWHHALTKAVAAREIAESIWHVPGDEAFIAGLLQDLGQMVLIKNLGPPYVRFLKRVLDSGEDLAALETASIGFSHTELTSRLLARWNLPDSLVKAVSAPRSPQGMKSIPASERNLAQILHLAELVAALLADRQPSALAELLLAGKLYRQLTEARLESLVGALQAKVEQLAEVLSLELPEGTDYRDILVRAHAQLSQLAAEAVGDLVQGHRKHAEPAPAEPAVLEEARLLSDAVARFASRPARAPASDRPDRGPAPVVAERKPSDRSKTYYPDARHATAAEPVADAALIEQLTAAVAACRQARRALSLILVEIENRSREVSDAGGLVERVRRLAMARAAEHPSAVSLRIPTREACFALILPDCDRRQAVEVGDGLLREIAGLPASEADGARAGRTVGVGVATVSLPPKNFAPESLLEAASRCLFGAHACGGNGLKSIEIY